MFTAQTYSATFTTPGRADSLGTIRIENGEHHRLEHGAFHLRIVSGEAWITFKGEDIFLYAGDQLVVSAGDETALVGSLRNAPLVFQVRSVGVSQGG